MPFESDKLITSIKVTNNWNDGTGGYVEIKSGGVNCKFVTIELTSQFSRGFDFNIEIWGRQSATTGRPPSRRGPPPYHSHVYYKKL